MSENDLENAIAIVGMSGKFPGAENIQTFWQNLCDGKDMISSFSDEELIASGVSKSQVQSPDYVKSRGVLKGIELFDASFFGFSSKEAQLTDPQHRLFLECAWEALENAGYCSENYHGSIGVYGGTGMSSYYLNNIHPNRQLKEALGDFLLHIGNDKDFLTTRVSYKLDLKGPSVVIQTACSTSLVAVCVACNHLLTYECDMALAGGVAISVPQVSGYAYQEGMILSKDGRCRPFDAEAQGTVMSNGVGVVVLKRLQDALADKDNIYSIIRGYGINNDGSGKISYSAPSVEGQAKAIASAICMADIDPETITYVETHGTGTLLGDPAEIQGLTRAFQTTKKQYCAIGSLKSNIGHTVEAAGVIGLIKAVLALHHRKIPPSLHFNDPNPHINFAETPFYVNSVLKDWDAVNSPRRASVSSFGIGGTNAHLILEEWAQENLLEPSKPFYSLILSAKTLSALQTMARNLGQHLQKHPDLSLGNVAFTLQIGRKLFEHKRILVCRNREEAISLLINFDPDNYPDTSDLSSGDLYKNHCYHRVPLPTYPFEKKRYWIDPPNIIEKPASPDPQYQSIEAALINIWKECLGTEFFGVDDDFFQLGGDSLLAIEVATNVSKKIGINLGMHALLAHPTIAKLSKMISEQKTTPPSLIKMKSGISDPPLFFIHPIEGNLFCYKELIDRLNCQNPLYGFQTVDTLENKSVEEIASHYIEDLCKVQSRGPYHLLGMSFGGVLAYEIARQLEEQCESVAMLCMLDVEKPDASLLSCYNEEKQLMYLIELLEGKPASDQKITPERLIKSLGLSTLSPIDQQIIFDRVKRHLKSLADYSPKSYGGKIIFFQANQRFLKFKDIGCGSTWKELVGNKVEIHDIPGNHVSMLKWPQVEALANFINAFLQSATV
jgi:3-oxoacyl-(acyl-carrier-protein) synthase/thioesterase domain-containing protein/acyl carrier protein